MQTTKERRAALLEHMQLIKQLPKEGIRISFENPKKNTPPAMTKTEQMYRR